jgi:hypothetical protein
MNERIDELMIEAGARFEFLHGVHYDDFQYKKFAQLIVRECLDIVNRKEYNYHEADPLWETAQLIKQHFGVENE